MPVEVVCNPAIMGSVPTVRGTRIPVEMIPVPLRAGYSRQEIFEDYPRLPLDGIEASIAWAEKNHGAHACQTGTNSRHRPHPHCWTCIEGWADRAGRSFAL